MSKKKKGTSKYAVGDVLEVKSFAGPIVHKRVLEKVCRRGEWKSLLKDDKPEVTVVKGFTGCFTRKKDILALKKQSVPYTGKERPSKTKSFTYDWQILRIIKKNTNK